MKKKIIFACMLLVFACMLCMGVMAQEETTYYLYDDGTALPEGENNISVSELYWQSESDTGLFANLKDGDNVIIELKESIAYKPVGTLNNNPTVSNCLRIDVAATVTVKFNGYSWWFTSNVGYDAFYIHNEGATLNLIGTKAKNPDGTIKEVGTGYTSAEIDNSIDVYSDYVIVYAGGGTLHCENLAAVCNEEAIYQKDNYLSGKVELELVDCSFRTKTNMYTISLGGKNNSNNNLRIDGGLYGSIQLHNPLDASYIKNATIKETAQSNALYIDSWKGTNAYDLIVENSTIDGRYWAEGDSNIIVGKNSSFGLLYLKGDGSGGAYAELTDCTYNSVDFTGNKGTGQLTVMTSSTCVDAGTKTVYTKDGSTTDTEYQAQNPALGHNIATPTGVHYENYFEMGAYTGICEYCKEQAAETTPSAPEFVTSKGFSTFNDNGVLSVTQGFTINKEMAEYFGSDFDYGILATVNANNAEFAPQLDDDGVVFASLCGSDFVATSIKLTNITNVEQKIVYCMYVKLGDSLVYLNNGTTSDKTAGLSFSEADALANQ